MLKQHKLLIVVGVWVCAILLVGCTEIIQESGYKCDPNASFGARIIAIIIGILGLWGLFAAIGFIARKNWNLGGAGDDVSQQSGLFFVAIIVCAIFGGTVFLPSTNCSSQNGTSPNSSTVEPSTTPSQSGQEDNPTVACAGVAGTECTGTKEYCHLPDGYCTMADTSGTCAKMPEVCTEMSAPVCGCDGQTYHNACYAGMAGVNVSASGACSVPAPERTTTPAPPPESSEEPKEDSPGVNRKSTQVDEIVNPRPAREEDVPPYPPREKDRRHRGRVVLHICVETDGSVSVASIKETSRYPALDEAALDWALRTQWMPGTVNGKAARVCFDPAFRFDPKFTYLESDRRVEFAGVSGTLYVIRD